MLAIWKILYGSLESFSADDGWALASHIAMSALIAIFPFLIFLTALAGFLGTANLSEAAVKLLFDTWPETVARPIANEVHNVLTESRGGLLTLGAILALYFSSSGIEALRTGLNRAYALKEQRPWWLLRLQSIAMVLVAAAALLIYAFLLLLGPLSWEIATRYAPVLQPLGQIVTLARFAITIAVLAIAMVIVHRWLPCKRYGYKQIAPGILLTVLLSVGFGEFFGIYLSEFATSYVSTYAGLASVMIALAFLYAISSIFLFGGELNASILRYRAARIESVSADRQPQ